MAEKIDLTGMNIPNHVAIILDGNGRWAKKRFLPRKAGHAAGARTVEKILEDAHDIDALAAYDFGFETIILVKTSTIIIIIFRVLSNFLINFSPLLNSNHRNFFYMFL